MNHFAPIDYVDPLGRLRQALALQIVYDGLCMGTDIDYRIKMGRRAGHTDRQTAIHDGALLIADLYFKELDASIIAFCRDRQNIL